MEREMLPGNHKDTLPLISIALTLPRHFLCLVFILLTFSYSSVSLFVLNFFPPRGSFSNRFEAGALLSSLGRNLLLPEPSTEVEGSHYPGKLWQCTNVHFPGAYLGIKRYISTIDTIMKLLCFKMQRIKTFDLFPLILSENLNLINFLEGEFQLIYIIYFLDFP